MSWLGLVGVKVYTLVGYGVEVNTGFDGKKIGTGTKPPATHIRIQAFIGVVVR